jgi:hypothetical protein
MAQQRQLNGCSVGKSSGTLLVVCQPTRLAR